MPKANGLVKKPSLNGHVSNGNSVITKESLMLVPDKAIPTTLNGKDQEQSQVIHDNNNEVYGLFCNFSFALRVHSFICSHLFVGK